MTLKNPKKANKKATTVTPDEYWTTPASEGYDRLAILLRAALDHSWTKPERGDGGYDMKKAASYLRNNGVCVK